MTNSIQLRWNRISILATVLGIAMLSLLLPWGLTVYAVDHLSQTAEVGGIHKVLDLEDYIEVLEDKDHRWTIEQIADPTVSKPFIPYKTSHLSGSISDSAYWVSVRLSNHGATARSLLLELSKPHLSHVTLYQFDANGHLAKAEQTGRALPFNERTIHHRNFLFDVMLQPDSELYIYAQIRTDSYLQIPMKLWETESFMEKDQYSNLILGMYYGVMLVMALYNSFLYLSLRDRSYLYYVLYVLSFALLQSIWDGFAYQFLWPGYPVWESKSNPVFIALTVLFMLLFSRRFLSVSKHTPKVGKILSGAIICIVLSLPFIVLMKPALSAKWALFVGTTGIVFFCIFLVGAFRYKSRAAYLYIGAWMMLITGTLMNVLAAYKLIPFNFLALYSPRIGSIAEIIIFSLALADYLNTMRQEKAAEEKQGILLKWLHEITKKLTSTYDPDQLLSYAIEGLSKITKCEDGWILLKTGDGYEVKAAAGAGGCSRFSSLEEDPFYEKLLQEKQVVMNSDMGRIPWNIDQEAITCIGIPIVYHEGLLGMIVLYSRSVQTLSKSERRIIFDFAGQVGISIENARLFHEINNMATTDGMTGVNNRTHFLKLADEAFKKSLRINSPLSMMMVDIDYFKKINDNYGHPAGDKVIQELAWCLTKIVQTSGVIGRYGGEEFLVLLPGMNLKQVYFLAETLRQYIEARTVPYDTAGTIRFTISLGIAAAEPSMKSVTDLINQTDIALYRAKERGRNRVEAIDAAWMNDPVELDA